GGRAARGDWRAEWALLRDAGVDGVFVDHPDLGAEVFRA
ncbi:MAG TPA: glycerophosphodiester phosphodiesterase, partial [Microbacterium sp.]|nr:glycerophosphodiester phosphodiesterase [Microbacterium sp.]